MNRLLKFILFIILVCIINRNAHAQGRFRQFPNNRPFLERRFNQRLNNPKPIGNNKLNAIKNAYINKQMNLTPEEADRFWPVYDRYQQELTGVLRDRRQNNSSPQPNGIDQVNREMSYDQQILNIKARYKDEFLRILPPDKVSVLYKSEREFKDELIKQLSERSSSN